MIWRQLLEFEDRPTFIAFWPNVQVIVVKIGERLVGVERTDLLTGEITCRIHQDSWERSRMACNVKHLPATT